MRAMSDAAPSKDLACAAHRDVLGECPVWDAVRGVLWWIDIRAPGLRCLRPAAPAEGSGGSTIALAQGQIRSWPLPHLVGSIALTDDPQGRLLMALGQHLVLFDPDLEVPTHDRPQIPPVGQRTGPFETLAEVAFTNPQHRFNDGRCDPAGRFWVGTMNNITRGPEGRMFRLDASQGLVEFPELAPGLRIPNSLAFSPDGRTLYFADSLDHAIRAIDYDAASGTPGSSRPFASITAPAFPDGSTVDAEGGLWNTHFHGGCLVRHRPDGTVDRVIELPVRRPTCCAFGGPGLRTLYVTTTCQHMSDGERAAEPLAGALLALDVGHHGLPEPRFRFR